jgi:hypothetical protein
LETITSTSRQSQLRTKRKASFSSFSTKYAIAENAQFSELKSGIYESFPDYIARLHIPGDLNLMVLPYSKHYYYESKDLKKVKILVNPKRLNDIKNIRDFLFNISSVLPLKSYFIGTFFNYKDKNILLSDLYRSQEVTQGSIDLVENGISSRIPFLNFLYRLIDFRIERYMTKTTVSFQLANISLKVLNMTDINGLTYFCAQKILSASQSSS